ncbi:MAG: helix-turn-helix domain-containing protein [Isosphaeraceae bacterium]
MIRIRPDLPSAACATISANGGTRLRPTEPLLRGNSAMALSEEQLRTLLNTPSETLGLELKTWIDPATDEGKAKIAISCMALRNNNGGQLVIGFNDDGKPEKGNAPADIPSKFHFDVIQRIVGQFSSEPFPVEIQFADREGTLYPVISVPFGIRTPVAARRSLGPPDKPLVRDNAVYVRSLSANYTVSSSEARRGDWDRLIQICLDNREADIGAFVRRHLAGLNLDRLGSLLSSVSASPQIPATARSRAVLDEGRKRFLAAVQERGIPLPQTGFREAAVVVDGDVPQHTATMSFLQKLFVAQPKHTGWPAWTDSRRLSRDTDHPYVYDRAWEALLVELGEGAFIIPHIDFWKIDPQGIFYQLNALEDDLPLPAARPQPRTQIDFLLQISRTAETISVALSFARSMGCDPVKTSLAFAFRWSGLKDRHLGSWVEPRRTLHAGGPARQDQIDTSVIVPLDTPRSAIGSHVVTAVRNLFALFGGTELDNRVVEQIAEDALQVRF